MQSTIEKGTRVANPEFAELASDEQIRRTALALEANNIRALVAENRDAAAQLVIEQLAEGAEIFTASSQTLEQTGISAKLERLGKYRLVRKQLATMDSKTQTREMVKLGAAPDVVLGSVHAVTQDGQVLVASNTGSQLGPYAAGSARVIWVVGAHKLVRDVDEGMRRIREYSYPLEDTRLMAARGVHSAINKILLVNREALPGRTTIIIVKEVLGF